MNLFCTFVCFLLLFRGYRSHRIQSVSNTDGGSVPRDYLYNPECQQRPGQLDEPQTQIPSKDMITKTAIGTRPRKPDESSAQSDFAARTTYWFVWPDENWPPNWAWFLTRFFFSILSPMEVCFLTAVASGLLSCGHLISSDIVELIAQILFKLNWAGWWHH